jgi:hypothetical protein
MPQRYVSSYIGSLSILIPLQYEIASFSLPSDVVVAFPYRRKLRHHGCRQRAHIGVTGHREEKHKPPTNPREDADMNEQEVIALMETSQSEEEWNANCDKVKAACGGGYPGFWFAAINMSGLMAKIVARWGGDDQIKIQTLP